MHMFTYSEMIKTDRIKVLFYLFLFDRKIISIYVVTDA